MKIYEWDIFIYNYCILLSLKKDQIEFFHSKGYLKINNIVEKNQINDLGKTILLLCHKYAKDYFYEVPENDVFSSQHFHNSIIKLKAEKPTIFGAIYDSVQCSVSLQSILLNKKILECISSLSGEPTQFHSLFHCVYC